MQSCLLNFLHLNYTTEERKTRCGRNLAQYIDSLNPFLEKQRAVKALIKARRTHRKADLKRVAGRSVPKAAPAAAAAATAACAETPGAAPERVCAGDAPGPSAVPSSAPCSPFPAAAAVMPKADAVVPSSLGPAAAAGQREDASCSAAAEAAAGTSRLVASNLEAVNPEGSGDHMTAGRGSQPVKAFAPGREGVDFPLMRCTAAAIIASTFPDADPPAGIDLQQVLQASLTASLGAPGSASAPSPLWATEVADLSDALLKSDAKLVSELKKRHYQVIDTGGRAPDC